MVCHIPKMEAGSTEEVKELKGFQTLFLNFLGPMRVAETREMCSVFMMQVRTVAAVFWMNKRIQGNIWTC